jgi:hypothetical protein
MDLREIGLGVQSGSSWLGIGTGGDEPVGFGAVELFS